MKTANHFFFFLLIGVLLPACSNDVTKQNASSAEVPALPEEQVKGEAISETSNSQSKQYHSIRYSVHVMRATDFLAQKGEVVEAADKEALSKETVLILTLGNSSPKAILEHPQLQLDKEDVLQYLVGDLLKDVSIEQGGKTIHPTGSSFEQGAGAPDKLRAFLHFTDVKADQPMQVVFYDRMFGAGMIRFSLNKPHV